MERYKNKQVKIKTEKCTLHTLIQIAGQTRTRYAIHESCASAVQNAR